MDPNGTTVTTCIICTLIEAVSRTLACPPGAADNSSEGTGVADYKRVGLIASTSDVFRPLLRCESLSASESVKTRIDSLDQGAARTLHPQSAIFYSF